MVPNPMNKWMIWGYHCFWKHPYIYIPSQSTFEDDFCFPKVVYVIVPWKTAHLGSWIHGTLTLFAKGHGGSSSISCPWWWWEGLGCATGICLCADSVVRCLPYKLVLRKLQHPKTLPKSLMVHPDGFFRNWLEKVQFFPFSKQPYQRNNKADVACCRLHIVALQEL